jgi:hypothetical protein
VSPSRRSASSLLEAIARRFPADGERPSFVRGLAMGALVGAAIAGSTLWTRWRARRDGPQDDGADASTSSDAPDPEAP